MSTEASERVPWSITVPGTPPSVNHYTKHTRSGRHYTTSEATAFMNDLGIVAVYHKPFPADKKARYEISITIYLGEGQRGDIDNFPKLCLDGLVKCGAIHSDAAVDELLVQKGRDWKYPRTVITVAKRGTNG